MLPSMPIFIIGAPRSGTKLLRALLNNHPDISLGTEGNFVSALLTRFGVAADVSQPYIWSKIYSLVSQNVYHQIKTGQGLGLSEQSFLDVLNARAEQRNIIWADIFEILLRAYGPDPKARLYGDKSHGYLNDVAQLRMVFENVRFLYIVRDPRDQALSAFKLWGRHPLRSAQHWYAAAHQADKLGFATANDVLTVRYEDLTSSTDSELARICTFLEVPYQPEMATLLQPAESFRRGYQLETVTVQHAKYREGLSPKVIRHVSEVTLPFLSAYGYAVENAQRHRKLRRANLKMLSYVDGFSMLRFHARDRGLVRGVAYYLKRHTEAKRSFKTNQKR